MEMNEMQSLWKKVVETLTFYGNGCDGSGSMANDGGEAMNNWDRDGYGNRARALLKEMGIEMKAD